MPLSSCALAAACLLLAFFFDARVARSASGDEAVAAIRARVAGWGRTRIGTCETMVVERVGMGVVKKSGLGVTACPRGIARPHRAQGVARMQRECEARYMSGKGHTRVSTKEGHVKNVYT